ncbi:hypothetical protein IGI37_003206 [Enterococcus sp. AZ194]|uniref:hypothetical protein n=1 Tax=Enterococcus sp. AZ194 TaxID=2774629 RepID=UPI003F1F078F
MKNNEKSGERMKAESEKRSGTGKLLLGLITCVSMFLIFTSISIAEENEHEIISEESIDE